MARFRFARGKDAGMPGDSPNEADECDVRNKMM